MDKRHSRRLKIVQELFMTLFNKGDSNELSDITKEVLRYTPEFDHEIEDYAQKYSADKIAKVDLSILRLALFELKIEKKTPPKVILNEAIELGKELGGDKSPAFINAVLGKVYEKIHDDTQ